MHDMCYASSRAVLHELLCTSKKSSFHLNLHCENNKSLGNTHNHTHKHTCTLKHTYNLTLTYTHARTHTHTHISTHARTQKPPCYMNPCVQVCPHGRFPHRDSLAELQGCTLLPGARRGDIGMRPLLPGHTKECGVCNRLEGASLCACVCACLCVCACVCACVCVCVCPWVMLCVAVFLGNRSAYSITSSLLCYGLCAAQLMHTKLTLFQFSLKIPLLPPPPQMRLLFLTFGALQMIFYLNCECFACTTREGWFR